MIQAEQKSRTLFRLNRLNNSVVRCTIAALSRKAFMYSTFITSSIAKRKTVKIMGKIKGKRKNAKEYSIFCISIATCFMAVLTNFHQFKETA